MTTLPPQQVTSAEYSSIIANSMDGFVLIDLAGQIQDVNRSYCQLLGYQREELIGLHISDIDAFDDRAAVSRRTEEIIQHGSLRFETRQYRKNGAPIDLEISTNYLPGKGFCSFVRDISEYMRTRAVVYARLRLMEFARTHTVTELLQKTLDEAELLSGSQIGFYHFLATDQQTLTLQAWSTNTAAEFCKAEGAGSHYNVTQAGVWVDCVHQSCAVIHNDYAALPHRKGMPPGHATVFRELVVPVFRNDAIVAILGVGNKATDYDQQDIATVTLLADLAWSIAEQKLNEQALRESEERYRQLVDNLGNAVVYQITANLDGMRRFTYVSKAVERLNEVTVEAVLADPGVIYRQILPKYHPMLTEREQEAIATVNVFKAEVESRLPSGKVRWFEYTSSPRRRPDGSIVWDAIELDITERKQLEEELRTTKAAAEAANHAKSEFLANMSHEIRTPMNGVIGNVQLLRFTDLSEQQQKLVSYIEIDAKHLISVINDVLDISKIEAGKLEIVRAPFSLRRCIDELVTPHLSRIAEKGLCLHTSISEAIPDNLIGDQLHLRQVVRNLLGNAIKFTETGELRLTVAVHECGVDTVTLHLQVADTGIGIQADALQQIFAPFSQADASVTRRFGGTGLGLSICNRLVGLMGGSIGVESEEGNGSTFHVILPFGVSNQTAVPEEGPTAADHQQTWHGPSLNILLVDDSTSSRLMAEGLLTHFGHQVTSLDNGAEAVLAAQQQTYDLVLMDIQMPVMGGIEATSRIRDHERNTGGHLPVIALTAHALKEQQDNLLLSGFDGYVAKPLELGLLLAEIRRVLGLTNFDERPEATGTTPNPP